MNFHDLGYKKRFCLYFVFMKIRICQIVIQVHNLDIIKICGEFSKIIDYKKLKSEM